jgi:GTPase SAR1 family protein
MIIVSGPDNSGKTTLVKKLAEDLKLNNLPKCKSLPLWEHPLQYSDWIIDTIKKAGPHDIVDRCFIDEIVYGPVMRGRICFSALQSLDLSHILVDKKPLIIIPNPGADRISQTYAEREQYPELHQNLRVLFRYYEVMNEYPFNQCPQYIFDYRFDPNYEIVKHVAQMYILKQEYESNLGGTI